MGLSQKAAAFAGERPAVHVGEPDVRRQSVAATAQPSHCRPHARVVVGGGVNVVAVDTRIFVARERQVNTLAVGTAGVLVTDAADDGVAVGLFRQGGLQRADLRAGYAGSSGRELAAHLDRSVWLQIERIHLRRTAAHKEKDARPGSPPANSHGSVGASAEQVWHGQARRTQAADL
jgi:hypothetical protein